MHVDEQIVFYYSWTLLGTSYGFINFYRFKCIFIDD